MAKQLATTAQKTLVNQVRGGEKNIMQRIATAYIVAEMIDNEKIEL